MKLIVALALASSICTAGLAQLPSATPAIPATPTNPPAPSAPVAPATTTPPFVPGLPPATPGTPGVSPSPTSTTDDTAAIHKSLGNLSPHLVAALSMDNEANGSMIISRPPASGNATFSLKKRFATDQGRQCADFSEAGTMLSVYRLDLGSSWTLAMWAKLPFAGQEAVLWRSSAYTFLCIRDSKFKSINTSNGEAQTFGDYDKSWTGWHHIALTSDGSKNTLYVDGMPIGTVPASEKPVLSYVGGQINIPSSAQRAANPSPGAALGGQTPGATPAAPTLPTNYQCSLLDDMFVFSKALNTEELETVAMIRLPSREIVNIPNPETPNTPAPAPISMEGSSLATELVKSFSNSLIFVSSSEGSGSGFIADFAGKPFLVTNAHVAAGVRGAAFRTLQGTTVNIGPASVAVGHDIFVMQAKTVDNPVTVMRDVGENAAIGDEIVVLGNAEGGGVINTIMGRIVGIGPNLIEVDAAFQPGNSGSPIIHLKSKKAIGVATYLTIRKYDTATRAAIKEPIIRRFGYRIDSVKNWQPVDWNAFYAQATEIDNIEKLTDDFVTLIKDIADDSRVMRGKHTNPTIRSRIDSWLSSKSKHMSAKDAISQDQNFLSFLKIACQTDVTTARQRLTYDYFVRQLGDQQRERSEIAGVFNKIIETVR